MSVLYHLTILPPKMPECEAISQEVDALRNRFGGRAVYLNPNLRSPVYIPRILFGLQKLKQLRTLEGGVRLHHIYNPDPFPFPVLRFLNRPVVYSLTGGMRDGRLNVPFFSSLGAVTVFDESSLAWLKRRGLNNACLVSPGIDTRRFTCTRIPLHSLHSEIKLMVGSAPWTRVQFRTKGVDALLSAAQRSPRLHLVFLWRGVLAEEMARRVHRLNLGKRVTVLNEQVNVNRVLAQVHASITLAADPDIVKAYPHSLLESLAAGKPVLISRAIPMADYAQRTGCGTVVERVTASDILAAIDSLVSQYSELQRSAQSVGQRDFSLQRLIYSFQTVYERVLGQPLE